jgi:hypothetical protein
MNLLLVDEIDGVWCRKRPTGWRVAPFQSGLAASQRPANRAARAAHQIQFFFTIHALMSWVRPT